MKKNRKYISLALLFILCGIVAAYFSFPFITERSSKFQKDDFIEVKRPVIEVNPTKYKSRLLMFGDVFWGRRVDGWSMNSSLKFSYPFSQLNTFEKDKYDAWIANLECPVTKEQASNQEQEVLLKFSCKPEYLVEASKWFEVFSLSNNHTNNMEEVNGLQQTRDFLENSNIQYFGHYDNAFKEDICEVIYVNSTGFFENEDDLNPNFNAINSKISIPIALCGYHNLFKIPKEDEINVISEYSKHFLTIVMPHHGVEYVTTSDNLKRETFRKMIDAGADLIVGGHPHTVQESEVYKNKLIIYSTGNFIFDQQGSKLVTQGIGLDALIETSFDEVFEWSQNFSDCQLYKDECLTLAKEKDIEKPNFKLSYDIVATNSDNKITKRGSETDLKDMLARLGWDKIKDQLGYE